VTAVRPQNSSSPSPREQAGGHVLHCVERRPGEDRPKRRATVDDRARLAALARLAVIAGRGGLPNTLLDDALQVLRELLSVDFISVAVNGPGPNDIELVVGSRRGEPYPRTVVKRQTGGLTEGVLASCRTLAIPDLRNCQFLVRWMQDSQVRSYVGVPLQERGSPYGVLSVQSDQVDAFDSEDVSFVEAVSGVIGAALGISRERGRLEELTRFQERFVAMVAHDLRAPLQTVLGFGELLADGVTAGDQAREAGAAIADAANRMQEITGDLLELVEVRQEDLLVGATRLDLYEETARVVAATESCARDRGIEVQLTGVTVTVRLPQGWVARIVENLLANALKYTPSGGRVEIVVDSDEQWAWLRVADTGFGFDSGESGRIFEPFVRLVGDERVKAKGGSGLGLSIAREMIERAGGTIEASSAGRDRGAVFVVRFPRAAPEAVTDG
jgi:signal transduction histidine kinase